MKKELKEMSNKFLLNELLDSHDKLKSNNKQDTTYFDSVLKEVESRMCSNNIRSVCIFKKEADRYES